jgi:hypothetical protein
MLQNDCIKAIFALILRRKDCLGLLFVKYKEDQSWFFFAVL